MRTGTEIVVSDGRAESAAEPVSIRFTLSGVDVGAEHRAIPPSANARLHWAARARWTKAWRQQSGLAALVALRLTGAAPFPGVLHGRASVAITLCTIRQLDTDNAHATVKPILDGLKGVLIVDDSPDHIELAVKQVRVSKRIEERVEVEVTAWM